mgnify:FL=1
MDLLTLCSCCFLGGLIIFIVALVLGQKRMRQVEEVMRQLAERQGGHFTPGNLLYNPCITLNEGGRQLRLYAALGGRDDPSHTELRVELLDDLGGAFTPAVDAGGKAASPYLSVRPHSFKTRLTITLGAKPFLTGDQAFDEAFDARGAPEELVRRCLNPQVRQSLLALKAYRPVVRIGRVRSWLPGKRDKTQATVAPAPRPFLERILHPSLQFTFYTAGLPADIETWEPRLEAARLMLAQVTSKQ